MNHQFFNFGWQQSCEIKNYTKLKTPLFLFFRTHQKNNLPCQVIIFKLAIVKNTTGQFYQLSWWSPYNYRVLKHIPSLFYIWQFEGSLCIVPWPHPEAWWLPDTGCPPPRSQNLSFLGEGGGINKGHLTHSLHLQMNNKMSCTS